MSERQEPEVEWVGEPANGAAELPTSTHSLTGKQLATEAHGAIADLFALLPPGWMEGQAARVHTERRDRVIRYLTHKTVASVTFIRERNLIKNSVQSQQEFEDPKILLVVAELISLLFLRYLDSFEGNDRLAVRTDLFQVLESVMSKLPAAVDGQLRQLAKAFCIILNQVRRRRPSNVYLLEFPIGNSLPVELLQPLLRRFGVKVSTLRASLSRNEKRKRGATRTQLIRELLDKAAPGKTDLVILMDEWVSGINFQKVTGDIELALQDRATTFLPLGLLTSNSVSVDGFEDRRKKHDAMLLKAGERGEDFRVIFPPLPTMFAGPFLFFAESDRLAGYRKGQLYGSMFCCIDTEIQRLASNREFLLKAKSNLVGHSGRPLEEFLTTNNETFVTKFEISFRDYQQCRGELETIMDASGVTTSADAKRALDELVSHVQKQVAGRACNLAMAVAAANLGAQGIVDPEDRYYFKGRVPFIVELPNEGRFMHDFAIKHLTPAVQRMVDEICERLPDVEELSEGNPISAGNANDTH